MAKASPRAAGWTSRDRRRGSARSLAVIALSGVVLLAIVGWWMLASAPPSTGAARPMAREPDPSSDPGQRRDARPLDAGLEDRIRAAARRSLETVTVTIPLATADGVAPVEPVVRAWSELGEAPQSEVVDGMARLRLPGFWPEIALLTVASGDHATAVERRLVLPGADAELEPIRLSRGARLAGRVVTSGGDPAPDVRVYATEVESDPLPSGSVPGDVALADARSDESGSFLLERIGQRRVRLCALGPLGRANAVLQNAEAGGAPVKLALAPAGRIDGVVVDVRGQPIAGARVGAVLAGPQESSFDVLQEDTGEDGRFILAHLEPGYHTISAAAPGFLRRTIARVHTDVSGLRLALSRLPSAKLDLIGAPADADVPVVWRTFAQSGAIRRPTSAPRVAWMRDGRLELAGLPAGTHGIELQVPGAAPVFTPAVTFALDQITELGSFTLAAGATLAAIARHADGRPLRARAALAAPHHARIALERDVFALPDRLERLCDGDGRLRWEGLPPGERVLSLRHSGCADRNVRVTIPESGTLDLGSISLQPAGALEGDLRDPLGRPLGQIEITARRLGGSTRSTATTIEGRYEFQRLEPGRYELTVLARDEAPPADLGAAVSPRDNVTKLVDVPAGETRRCDFTVEVR
jgi:hypothetical protein